MTSGGVVMGLWLWGGGISSRVVVVGLWLSGGHCFSGSGCGDKEWFVCFLGRRIWKLGKKSS